MKDNIGFIKDFARKGRFIGEGDSFYSASEPIEMDEIDEGRGLALLAYIPFLCFIPYIKGKNTNRFAYEHGKQGIILFLFEIVAILGALFWKVALFLAAIVALAGVIYVIQGKLWKIPWIGPLGEKIEGRNIKEEVDQ
ncbi:hypothetical protein KAH81_06965 [bacterium]|nr:hypothetical protein [bacterium]